tara:strand:+ start:485 stop:1153 length:669 start_codon:yes stop_codon:yes gene_type:complete
MSNYTLAVNWSGKDALADSDAAKVISGTDFNTEFTTVQTAVNSKADLNGSSSEDFAMNNGTIAGNVTAPTQTAGNNTTRLATTAFVTTAVAALDAAAINNLVYPVGSIYTTISTTAPATLLGMGTWAAFGAGKVPVGIDASDTDFDTAEETGGTKTHTLSISEIPSHTHGVPRGQDNGAIHAMGVETEESSINYANSQATGGGSAHNNLQPYIVVYMWKRTG